ncbi:9f3158d9-8f6d-4cb3-b222-c95680d75f3e [Thermothielavioides terrestris]|uniref:Glycosyltransferase family 15 protein n=2 Tax=Thermothielavioides terrestris TaxID=2587410 RepID=G2QZ67_THETT|nr:glycosyltransferase family 15 protein [Thermothielavioides terrestris NRRL 8126]AEO66303.1 glycosyltransferase family 15 protein [Thermothielavioides terrestris NRRL 8126]SPQ25413.1 9f3158d9-8f6d-4cb3-b222-c95680d75f3e [Thermothielavioides terrestris]
MATGSARHVRYVLIACFLLAVFYFVSNSRDISPSLSGQFAGTNTKSGNAPEAQQPVDGSSSSVAKDSPNQAKIKTNYDPSEFPMALKPGDPGWDDLAGIKDGPRMNATFVTLARNSDVWEIAKSIRQVEDRFNRRYNYDWVFLNDQPFDDTFKKVTTSLVSGKTHYGLIPVEHWSFPEWIDRDKAEKVRQDMKEAKIIYGDSVSYRHMCRFESGFFFRQELMMNYDYYWRVEPSIELYCDIHYDPFRFMHENNKKYGFVISLYEYIETIPTLWDSVKKFMKNHPEHIAAGNAMGFLSEDGGETYNKCHFWSNFEIGSLNWLRSKAYIDYFESLDRDGGFFYERWGDAPVHSIAAALMLPKEEIHFFEDIAYYHVPFTHCPTDDKLRTALRCHCNPNENFDWKGYSCTTRWFDINNMEKPEGWEDQKK